MRSAAVLFALCLPPQSAYAALPRAVLDSAGIFLPQDARFPLDMTAPDSAGATRTLRDALARRAGFVLFADYTCKSLCGPALALLGSALERSGGGNGVRVAVIGLDPKDSARDAIRMRDAELPAEVRSQAVFLLPDKTSVARAAAAAGFRYVYDKAVDQFAHPEAVYAVAADGRIVNVLTPFSLTTGDIGASFSRPRVEEGGLAAALRTICYRFGVLSGPYTGMVERMLQIAGAITLVSLAGGLWLLRRRRAAP